MTKIPENSATESPDDLQQTSFECACGEGFETAQALANHTVGCDGADATDLQGEEE